MKIVLRAFQGKLSGVMEVPENTGLTFKLAMTQPIQFKMNGSSFSGLPKTPLMDKPLHTMCEFEYTGGTFSEKDHPWDNAKEYQLVRILN